MYNEKQKREFISQYTYSCTTAENCARIFNLIENLEKKYDRDICTLTKEEIGTGIEELSGVRQRSSWGRFIVLRDYAKWCLQNGILDACDGILNVEISGLDTVRSKTVANPTHLQMYLDALFDPEDAKTVHNAYRAYAWLAYAGMKEEDIQLVTSNDIDLVGMIVRFRGKEYPLYRESVKCIRNCMDLSDFHYEHKFYTIWKSRASGNSLVRGFGETRGDSFLTLVRSIMSTASRNARNAGKTTQSLCYFRFWISGVFFRMHEREICGMPVSFSGIVAEVTDGKTYKLDSGRNTIQAKYRQLERDYEEDYKRWKLAFKL